MESRQLHVYKYFCEQITGKRIRKMFFVFVPKVNIKQKKTESSEDFRQRILMTMQELDVEVKEVIYDPQKVTDFFETCMKIQYTQDFEKCQSGILFERRKLHDFAKSGKKTGWTDNQKKVVDLWGCIQRKNDIHRFCTNAFEPEH